ncbi:MAG: PKD domain-containing protein [Acidimicrobiales bacterium]
MEQRESWIHGAARRRTTRRGAWALAAVLVGTSLVTGTVGRVGHADSAPADPGDPTTPTTVSADALPTVQIDGVVWSQTVVGNTVYVGGSFANARPAGAAPGTNLTPRSNFLAYNLTTGELITTFAPSFNAQVRTVVASADGTRLYVGGDFTSVNGVSRSRIAAFDLATGNLVPFFPSVAYNVHAIVVHPSGSPVYVGGNFNAVGSVQRLQLAAFNAANGALLDWAPSAVGGVVRAMAISPDGSKIAVGGQFTTLNGSNNPGFGLGMLDAVTGANLPMAVNATVRNGGNSAGITSLVSDGDDVFGSGFWYGGTGNFESVFSASWNGGTLNWLSDCHGDTHSVFPQGGAVYSVGHSHECGGLGAQGFQRPNSWNYYRALAFSRTATGTLVRDPYGYFNFEGRPAPSLLGFFPALDSGTYTGQNQGPWHVTGNSQYIVMGGEFRNVNDAPQQGLVRFAVPAIAPDKQIPRLFLSNWLPTAASVNPGEVRITWSGNWDRDNEYFTYQVFRNDDGTRIATLSGRSRLYEMEQYGFTDTGLTPGSTVRYRVKAIDPFGNEAPSDWVTVTVSGGAASPYATAVLADRPLDYWRMGPAAGNSTDLSSNDVLVLNGSVIRGQTGALAGDPDTAVTFNGVSSQSGTTSVARLGRHTFSVEAWVRTTSTSGGKIVGFGNAAVGSSTLADRHLYIGSDGRVRFGVNPVGGQRVIASTAAVNDGAWHHVVGTLGGGLMTLYVDGAQVGQLTGVPMAQNFEGFWRVGGDGLSGWASRPSSDYLNGTVDEVAIYPRALTAAQVAQHFAAAQPAPPPNQTPTAAFSATTTPLAVAVDGSASVDPDGSIVSYAWTFGDGGTATGATASRTYSTAGTYTVTLTVTDDRGATASTTQQVIVPPAPVNQPPTAAFSATPTPLQVAVDGGASSDPDGSLVSYAWDFGDGGTATGATAVHTYVAPGTYEIELTVTDDRGATAEQSQQVVVPGVPVNGQPTAAFSATASPLQVAVNGAASSDPDGSIVSYAWDFGDGGTATGVTATRTYALAGTYTVSLTVTDDQGATNTATQTVVVPDLPVNQPPTAAFSATTSPLQVAVNGAASSDPDGTIVSYAWSFGDGGTATGVTATRAYAAAGTYTITLTVTDDQGATNTATQSVVVPAPPGPTPFATDAFGRTVASGLGTADTGGAWTLAGATTNFSVSGGTGNLRMSAAGAGVSSFLVGTSTDTEVRVSVGIDKPVTGGGLYLSAIGRKVGANDYRGRVRILANGQVQAFITTNVGGEVNLVSTTVAGLTFTSGDRLNIEFQVTGTSPTTLRLKVWKVGTTEPTAWTLTTTNANTSLQSGGGVGLVTYLSSSATNAPVIASFDDLWAGPTA